MACGFFVVLEVVRVDDLLRFIKLLALLGLV